MNKKICLVGGEDAHKRIPLSKYLTEAGFKVTILGTSKEKFPENINYIPYNLNRKLSLISDFKTLKWLNRFFKENTFDVIHTFDTKPALLVPLSQLKTKTPITRTITGLGSIFMDYSFFGYLLRRFYFILHSVVKKRVFMTVFQNNDDKKLYLKKKLINPDKFEIILSSGIELNNKIVKAKRDNTKFTFICVSRLVYEKGIVNFLEAAKICKTKNYDFNFVLVGPLEENSKRLNSSILKNYSDIVTWLGSRKNILKLLSESDAFVLPTFYGEGFPRVLLEAGAVGLPIISTHVTGVREFANHNKQALLVEPKNSNALAEAMITLATNKDLADELSENVIKHVKMFSLENVSKQYITIFNEAINLK
ncbi:glycosyltransferase [Formosa maritima]|uniref:Glycosyltransferase family 4 protein n=1 Tax=Formosa maritima TaxID=2592046 RepID=A0A5D0GMK8_9FLAO|nr:glycosyltransferase [Formosa maritima]TYA58937.1 glycosyltransferase family 4 protein [Formosa maritima]